MIPAIIRRRIHEPKPKGILEVLIWGSDKFMREFLHVDDMAAASVHLMELSLSVLHSHTPQTMSHINIGTRIECAILELAKTIAMVMRYTRQIIFDPSKSDGMPRKLLNLQRINSLGWQAKTELEQGLIKTNKWLVAIYYEVDRL